MGGTSKNFVVFSEIKNQITISQILEHYGVLERFTQKNGHSLVGPCLIHKGESKTSFKTDKEKNCWYCFDPSCRKGGNILDLVAAIEGVSIRESALLISGWFDLKNTNGAKKPKDENVAEPPPTQKKQEEEFNPPLKFSGLKGLDPSHESLIQRGFSKDTAEAFGAGYFSGKGIMRGKIAIPIFNYDGVLVGYAGRQVDPKDEAIYNFAKYFRPELEIYNLHRAKEKLEELGFLFLVPDIEDVWRMYEAGLENAVCCLGEAPSEHQVNLLLPPKVGEGEHRGLLVITYNDLDSEEELKVFASLSQKFFVKIMQFENSISEMDPDDLKRIIDRS